MKDSSNQNTVPGFLSGGGEMGKRIREFDWSSTPLGPVSTWPKSLMTCVQIMLTSRQPYWIGWGKELIKLYNDPYKAIVGGKHPHALGKPASEVWSDIWKDIGPMLKKVMYESEGTYVESQLLIMERNGYPEETYYTFSYTPVAGDSGLTEGMICANSDDTDRIVSERQLKTLTQLGKSLSLAKTDLEVYENSIDTIKNNPHDFPFALLYSLSGTSATLVNSTDFKVTNSKIPTVINQESSTLIAELSRKVIGERKYHLLGDLETNLGDIPNAVWEVPASKAIILPIALRGQKVSFGFLIVGLNPYRILNEKYLGLFELVADQIATSLGDVYALEEERKRLETLAELDRAKTTFFSNISHEFRTPLTLLLGPIQDVLNDESVNSENKERVEVAFRNALRMQKLVNLLLDFSRIEAGRMEANFVAVDIVSVTEDLASNFRSAIEKAGMELVIKKEVISEPVYVDIDMWEKIFLNLISNAFKYSERGRIEVSLKKTGNTIHVSVIDSGIGIPENEIDKIFDRFHRVQNVNSRSQEGTGIGLAMVKELVRLHDGTISVKSKLGEGSVFTVSIPIKESRVTHTPLSVPDKNIAQSSLYVEEAMQWTVSDNDTISVNKNENQYKVLLADDNADMRKYVKRLLETDYHVIVVNDGEQAFAGALEHKPDLILCDIMMPNLDGFGLLKKLKTNLSTRNTPVIFLSARAGEEARVEGIKAGADDYLTKPFSSKELLARVGNHIAISNARRRTEKEFYNLFLQSPAHIHVMKGPEHVFEFFHPLGIPFAGRDITGMKVRDAMPRVEGQGFFEMLDQVYSNGVPVHLNEAKALLPNDKGQPFEHYFNITYLPWHDLKGNIQGVLQFTFEVTETVKQRLLAEANERKIRSIAQQAPVAMAVLRGSSHIIETANERVLEIWDRKIEEVINLPLAEALPEVAGQEIAEILDNVYSSGKAFVANEMPLQLKRNGNLEKVYLNFIYQPLRNENNEVDSIIAVAVDVSEQVYTRQIVEEAEYNLSNALELADLGTWHIDIQNNFVVYSSRVATWWGLSAKGASLDEVINCIHQDDRNAVSNALNQALTVNGYYKTGYRLINAITKEVRFIEANGKVFYDVDKKPVRLSGTARDITLQKLTQDELERQVKLRTRELEEANVNLLKSNENLGQFAYVASHDLQEPLRKIQIFSDLVRNKMSDEKQVKSYIEKIDTSAARMSALIKDVLMYSQVNSENANNDEVDLNEILNNVKNDFELLIEQKGAQVISDQLPVIKGNKLQFHQLLSNLVGNSLKFSTESPVINITHTLQNGSDLRNERLIEFKKYHVFVFKDNGIGFDQSYADQIFGLFNRLHTRKEFSGTGIGLAICKRIVENHKGYIIATSKENAGATFSIYLPVRE